jgi:hypothetical protein
MRSRCEVAVDQASLQLIDPPRAVELPGAELTGRLRGDLQSVDDDGILTCYYLRPVVETVLPQWLVDFGHNVRRAPDTRLVAVYYEASSTLEQSCTAAGVGLMLLTEDNLFDLVVDFDELHPESLAKELDEMVKQLRRELDRKLDVQRTALTRRIADVNELTEGMTDETVSSFLSTLETRLRNVDDWAYETSKALDALTADFSDREYQLLKTVIETGSQQEAEDA